RGHPLDIYSLSHLQTYPLANGPLSVAPLALALAVAGWLGWLRSLALTKLVVVAVYSIFALLLAREAVRVIDRHASAPLRTTRRLLVYEVFLISLQLWQSMLYYGHVEQPLMLWLALVGVRALGEQRPGRAGVALGLALLTRSTALTIIIPVAALLLARRAWRPLLWLGAALAGVIIVGLAPFALADGRDLLYSLVTFHNTEAVNGGNLWTLVGRTTLLAIPQRADGLVVALAVLLAAGVTLRAQPGLRADSRDFYGLLALCALCHPALANVFWPYYLLEAFTFCAIWWLCDIGKLGQAGARGRWWAWGAAPLGITLLGQARQLALAQQFALGQTTAAVVALDALTTAALIALIAALGWRLTRRQPNAEHASLASA
ncbi:MAG: hypothetical protein KGO05_10220, partial [Chloroflexota bacterium]|nr:hypothetical protein [Chloroflexota bacterium]